MEGIIHKRTLILYGSICRLDESSAEKRLARRQLAIKGPGSYSWYVELKKILIKYDLPCCWDLLDNPMKKEHWKRLVNKKGEHILVNKNQAISRTISITEVPYS